jgi:hypothetical protein
MLNGKFHGGGRGLNRAVEPKEKAYIGVAISVTDREGP